MTHDQIANMFSYHPPTTDQAGRYELIREKAKQFAWLLEAVCPESREKSLAMTNLQQAVMWANASIAINEKPAEAATAR